MTRAETCGHCSSVHVDEHCQGLPVENCPWVRCMECGWITDHHGHTVEPPQRKATG